MKVMKCWKNCASGRSTMMLASYASDTEEEEEEDNEEEDSGKDNEVEVAACQPEICLSDLANLSLGNVKTDSLAPLFCTSIPAVAAPLIEDPKDLNLKPKGITHGGIYFN